jgi:hypothetical protein
MNNRAVAKVLGLVLAGVILLEVVYIVGAKIALKKLPEWVSYDALQITYSDAGSVVPGRVWVRDFVASGHDYNMQFEVRAAEAQVNVDLLAFLSRHFHATKAVTSGVEFRMRHNVETLDGQDKRIAAFPEIRGYQGPPVYPGPDPEPGPPQDAWIIEMDNVTAQVDDVWVVEYHYAGKGFAKGGFRLDPGRAFHLRPSEFTWEGGELVVGETYVSRKTRGHVNAEIHLEDVPSVSGLSFVDDVDVDLDLSLEDGDLAFLQVYQAATQLKKTAGSYSAHLRLLAERGKVQEGSRLMAKFDKVAVANPSLTVVTSGVVDVGAAHDADASVVEIRPFEVAVKDTVVGIDGSRSKSFVAQFKSSSARWLSPTPDKPDGAFQATIDAQLQPANALLGVALGKLPAEIADAMLHLPRLDTRVAVYLTKGRSRVELLKLAAGDIAATGAWQDRAAGATGAFKVSTPLLDVALALDRGGVSWQLE